MANSSVGERRENYDELLAEIYEELRRLARWRLSGDARSATMQATALVHEVVLRLSSADPKGWQNRGHLFAAATIAMRRILVERARKKARLKRGGGRRRVALPDELATPALETPTVDLIALDDALARLARFDRQLCTIVHLRFFAGFSIEDVAEVLGVSTRTVNRDWLYAKAWLQTAMDGSRPDEAAAQ